MWYISNGDPKYIKHGGKAPKRLEYIVETNFSPYGNEIYEIYIWCKNNCSEYWTDSIFFNGGFGKTYERVQYHFKDEDDAALFKLTWG